MRTFSHPVSDDAITTKGGHTPEQTARHSEPPRPEQAVDGAPLYDPRRMSKATVLVVDDEQLIRWSLVERLSQDGYRALEAETGAEALDQFSKGVD